MSPWLRPISASAFNVDAVAQLRGLRQLRRPRATRATSPPIVDRQAAPASARDRALRPPLLATVHCARLCSRPCTASASARDRALHPPLLATVHCARLCSRPCTASASARDRALHPPLLATVHCARLCSRPCTACAPDRPNTCRRKMGYRIDTDGGDVLLVLLARNVGEQLVGRSPARCLRDELALRSDRRLRRCLELALDEVLEDRTAGLSCSRGGSAPRASTARAST